MSYVLFFDRLCRCLHCGRDTYACVEENSGTINCTECDEIIFDARDTSGTVVILELEEKRHTDGDTLLTAPLAFVGRLVIGGAVRGAIGGGINRGAVARSAAQRRRDRCQST